MPLRESWPHTFLTKRTFNEALSRISQQGHCFADIMCSLCCAPCVACQLLAETGKRGSVVDDWDEETGRRDYEQPWKFGLFNCLDDCVTCEFGNYYHRGVCVSPYLRCGFRGCRVATKLCVSLTPERAESLGIPEMIIMDGVFQFL